MICDGKKTLPPLESAPNRAVGDRVLIAEDDPISRKILQTWLENWGYHVTVAKDGAQAWRLLHKECSPDLLILDWVMPGIEGPDLCRRIREEHKDPYRYILLVTANDHKKDVVMGLDAGADDYLTKPFDTNELRARLTVGNRILALHRQLSFQATHDTLTDVWNRGAVLDLLRRELLHAARSKTPTGVLMLDLDHFKKINDTYGHLAGDVVLKETAQRITGVVRAYDVVGRYGGEEFLVVLPDCDYDQVQRTAERIRAVVMGSIQVGGSNISVTVSLGAAAATPGGVSAKQILATADAALYRAKNSGRNRVAVHSLLVTAAGRRAFQVEAGDEIDLS